MPVSRLNWRSRFRSSGVTRKLTGTIFEDASGGAGGMAWAAAGGASTVSSSRLPKIEDRSRPFLVLIVSSLFPDPIPHAPQLRDGLAGARSLHFTDATSLKRGILINRPVGQVVRADRIGEAGERRSGA